MPDIVVADTGPLHYLVLVGHIAVLPRVFGTVVVPATFMGELRHANTPDAVRAWASDPPPWPSIHADHPASAELCRLDPGERTVIALAGALGAELLLMDDRAGGAAARDRGFRVTGTVGILLDAATQGLLDLTAAFAALRATNFRIPVALLDALLREHACRDKGGAPEST